jgi:hypothetical protein
MRISILVLSICGLMAAGCFSYSAPAPPPTSMTAWSPTGGFTLNSGGNCAGQVGLIGGYTTVTDACFTSSYNVVVCTDNTAAKAVRCTPSIGSLSITGNGNDSISYARLK